MKVIKPGQEYELRNLKSSTTTNLKFYQCPDIHGELVEGPSSQEVIRALIDRVKQIDKEQPWPGNALIIQNLRNAIALFEFRALLKKIDKEQFPIEEMMTGRDGHLVLLNHISITPEAEDYDSDEKCVYCANPELNCIC